MYDRLSLMFGKLMTLDLSDLKREEGQGVTEYTLVLAFVAIALAAVLIVLKGGISTFINLVNNAIGTLPGFS
jgi:Flp pilus assembly pilin Flp